jgi:hypothetical protein
MEAAVYVLVLLANLTGCVAFKGSLVVKSAKPFAPDQERFSSGASTCMSIPGIVESELMATSMFFSIDRINSEL